MWRNFPAQTKLSRSWSKVGIILLRALDCHFLMPMLVPWGEVAFQGQARVPHNCSMYLWGVFRLTDVTSLLLRPWTECVGLAWVSCSSSKEMCLLMTYLLMSYVGIGTKAVSFCSSCSCGISRGHLDWTTPKLLWKTFMQPVLKSHQK